MIVGRLYTWRLAGGAIRVDDDPASATDYVVMIVADPRFVACRMPREANTPQQSGLGQRLQHVVHGLFRERGQCAAGCTQYGLGV